MKHVWGNRDEEAQYRALFHAGTWLVKPALLRDRLEVALARAQRLHRLVAVVRVDVEVPAEYTSGRGKLLNLLPLVAGRLRSAVRPDDTVGAVGDYRFVVVCNDLGDVEDLDRIIERLEGVITARSFQTKSSPRSPRPSTDRSATPTPRPSSYCAADGQRLLVARHPGGRHELRSSTRRRVVPHV